MTPSLFVSLRSRLRQTELMDAPELSAENLSKALRFLQRINRLFGYSRSSVRYLVDFSQNWRLDRPIQILDIATGAADIPLDILNWSKGRNFNIHITAIDLHPHTAQFAKSQLAGHQANVLRADALDLPFADQSFDYSMTSLFLHHLDDNQVVRALSEMNRVARRGIIIGDLIRNRRALFWIKLFTIFANPIVKHDGAVSVAQAFTRTEILWLFERAGIDYARYYRHFGHRFAIVGHKQP